jgi:hypothetical protein
MMNLAKNEERLLEIADDAVHLRFILILFVQFVTQSIIFLLR